MKGREQDIMWIEKEIWIRGLDEIEIRDMVGCLFQLGLTFHGDLISSVCLGAHAMWLVSAC